ncbi:MAG: hypothetical protein R3323_04670 [Wenzhouxiangellaceae bacterium]|nr:hypothetical protein [Wenzhouxiangellaceae bacterium]
MTERLRIAAAALVAIGMSTGCASTAGFVRPVLEQYDCHRAASGRPDATQRRAACSVPAAPATG